MRACVSANPGRALRLVSLLAIGASLLLASCVDDRPTADPEDFDPELASASDLLDGAPANSELSEDGKFDAVYPERFDLAALQSPVRNQASRGVCSIFATVALMEHLYIREGTIAQPDFSEQFLQWSVKNELGEFATTGGSNAAANLRAINRFGVVAESVWPYESSPWTTSNDPRCTGETQPTICWTNGDPAPAVLQSQRFKLPAGRYVNSRPNSIKAFITENQSGVIAGMTFFYQAWNHRRSTLPVNAESFSEGYVLYPNEEDRRDGLEKRAGHAILIVGWDDTLEVQTVDAQGRPVVDAQGTPVMERGFWLIKNSWGTSGFGIRNPFGAGYGWLSMRYVEEYASCYGSDEPTVSVAEVCDDDRDNDGDSQTDCDDPDCASAPACQAPGQQYSATPAAAIPDNDPNGVTSVITVADAGTIGTLAVTVDIAHSYIGDLVVSLAGPDGTSVTLHNRAGGSADSLRTTFTPTEFAGKALAGDWTLRVADLAGADTGTLASWSLGVTLQ